MKKNEVDMLDCENCGYSWETGANPETHCPMCRTRLDKPVSKGNIKGDIWRPAVPSAPTGRKVSKA